MSRESRISAHFYLCLKKRYAFGRMEIAIVSKMDKNAYKLKV